LFFKRFRKWIWKFRGRRFNRRLLRYAMDSGLRVRFVELKSGGDE